MTPDFVWLAAKGHQQKTHPWECCSPRATRFLYRESFFFLPSMCGGWWALIGGGGGRALFPWSSSLSELCLSAYESGDGAE